MKQLQLISRGLWAHDIWTMSKVESSARPRASPSEVYPVEKLVAAFVVLSGLLMISVGTMGRF